MRLSLPFLALAACLAGGVAAQPDRAALDAFIAAHMAQARVPGASVAVIRGHRIAWARGFGIANTLTREPVAEATAFPAASSGKPIAAWLAVQLAAHGQMALDAPVGKRDLHGGADDARFTTRQLLSHTAGLGNLPRDPRRGATSGPGARFAYSGAGYRVLQELVERRSGAPLDALARERLFTPLGMATAGFGDARPFVHYSAPHIELRHAVAPFLLLFLPAWLVALATVLVVRRVRGGGWRASRAVVLATLAFAAVAAMLALWQRAGSWTPAAWFTAVPLVTGVVAAALIFPAARAWGGRGAWATAAALVAVAFAFARFPLPMPAAADANAASSLRASAPDLARFMIELARPSVGDRAATRAMGDVQVRIDGRSAWGLGIGIERHAHGRDLWHSGSHPGAHSLMVIDPEGGDGVVVLANGATGSALVRAIAARVLGRQGCWHPACAVETGRPEAGST